jgi:predicted glycoside hydrolase/deacetylase ChbG (UPF0249 family)
VLLFHRLVILPDEEILQKALIGMQPRIGDHNLELIVNADDFGISRSVNAAVIRAFEMGMIDRTTAIANAPFFKEACQYSLENGLGHRIGIHFNLTVGVPLYFEMAHSPIFCSRDGRFKFPPSSYLYLTDAQRQVVSNECDCQIERFHDHGLYPIHLDSHHHVHTEWWVFRAIEPVLKKQGISSVRCSRNIGHSSVPKVVYKHLFNGYLKRQKWQAEDYFGRTVDILSLRLPSVNKTSRIEIMVHPTLSPSGVLIDAFSGEELLPAIKDLRAMLHSRDILV